VASRPFINQVRIALVITQSLLRKAIQDKDIPVNEGDAVLTHLDDSLTLIRPHIKKQDKI
jgi:hypothetical protein